MKEEVDNLILGGHELKINDRREIFLTGIKKIDSFDNEEFLMESNMGIILLKGSNLEIIRLDTHDGNVKIKGKIVSFTYLDGEGKETHESFFSKLFK